VDDVRLPLELHSHPDSCRIHDRGCVAYRLTLCCVLRYSGSVIRSFRHKGLQELFTLGRSRRLRADFVARLQPRLQALHRARTLGDLTLPGWRVHAVQGFDPVRHSLWVNGPWRITFEWIDGDAYRVDLEQYH